MEDAYGREHWPITGRFVTRPNILHHHVPRCFTRHSWLKSASVILVLVAAALLGAWAGGFLGWMTWTVALIDLNANEIHKWAHLTPAENGRLITALQKTGLRQSPAHHARHHQHRKNTHYCVITDYLNPLLDAVHLWDGLEWLDYRTTGVRRRHDDSVTLSNGGSQESAVSFLSRPSAARNRHRNGGVRMPLRIETHEYRARVEKLQSQIASSDLEVLIVTDPLNIQYLTGAVFMPLERPFFLVVWHSAAPAMLVPLLDFEHLVEENMVVSVEPGIYLDDGDERGGLRHSDTVLVTRDGYELLTRFPRDLDSLVIRQWKPLTSLKGYWLRRTLMRSRRRT